MLKAPLLSSNSADQLACLQVVMLTGMRTMLVKSQPGLVQVSLRFPNIV